MRLADYGISPERGFLGVPAKVEAPEHLRAIVDIAADLPQLIAGNSLRDAVATLPEVEPAEWIESATRADLRALSRDYGMVVQAYVWGNPDPPEALPACLARPFVALTEAVGVVPMLTYTDYVLDNWAIDAAQSRVSFENVRALRTFTGDPMEEWFIRIHIAIEAMAGEALAALVDLIDAANSKDTAGCIGELGKVAIVWRDIDALFSRLAEGCSAEFFFHHLRLYWHGWMNNEALPSGMIYEGVARFDGKPQQFRGVAGSQSAILCAMDTVLGVHHEDNQLTRYLTELDAYRMPSHRRFLADLAQQQDAIAFVSGNASGSITDAVDECRHAIAAFRSRHLEYAASYIHGQHKDRLGNDPNTGSGGVSFMRQLKAMRDSSFGG